MPTQEQPQIKVSLSWRGKIALFVLLIVIGLIYSTETAPISTTDNPTTETGAIEYAQTKAIVSFVIDGDTIILESKERVRLIGIDTPERGELGYEEARSALENLVLNKTITLVSQQGDRDVYERLLRDIYIDDIFVNLYMIENGFAVALPIPPNTKYAGILWDAEK